MDGWRLQEFDHEQLDIAKVVHPSDRVMVEVLTGPVFSWELACVVLTVLVGCDDCYVVRIDSAVVPQSLTNGSVLRLRPKHIAGRAVVYRGGDTGK